MPEDRTVSFEIDGAEYTVDLDDLTFDEWEQLEKVTGPLEQASKMTALRGIVFVALHRADSAFSIADLGPIRPSHITAVKQPPVEALAEAAADTRPPAPGGAPESKNDLNGSAEPAPEPQASDAEAIPVAPGVL